MNSTLTNVVRFAVAALLGLSACLVAWWPQSASGSGDVADLSPVAAAPTQMTPTAAPPPPAPPPTQAPQPQPTKKPTKKPHQSSGGSHHQPATLHNTSGGNHTTNHSSGSSGHQSTSSGHTSSSTGSSSSGSGSTPYVAPTAASTPAAPTKPATSAPTKAPTTKAPTTKAPTAPPSTEAAVATPSDEPSDTAASDYDTYLSSSEPVQTTSAPVWVVPGILLVLTSMLALLGGVLGRGNRPVLSRVRSASRNDERPAPPPVPQQPSMFKPAPTPDTE